MRRRLKGFCFCAAAAWMALGSVSGHAQILYVTRRAPRSPVPPMLLFPSSNTPVVVPQTPAGVVSPPVPAAPPSLTKAELDERVVTFQKRRAEEGSSSAQYELGVRYWTGAGVTKNVALGRKWLELAAQAGETQARDKLRELDRASK